MQNRYQTSTLQSSKIETLTLNARNAFIQSDLIAQKEFNRIDNAFQMISAQLTELRKEVSNA